MANCSIPNSILESGRISTRSLTQSKKLNNPAAAFDAFRLTEVTGCNLPNSFNAQRPTPNAQCSVQKLGRWLFDVGGWKFSFSGRVKGVWWPSRSSKPSSSRLAGRGRFDSYPLRLVSTICSRFAVRNAHIAHRATVTAFAKGGELDVA